MFKFRHWEVKRELQITRNKTLPMKSEFFFTERGARKYMRFCDHWITWCKCIEVKRV